MLLRLCSSSAASNPPGYIEDGARSLPPVVLSSAPKPSGCGSATKTSLLISSHSHSPLAAADPHGLPAALTGRERAQPAPTNRLHNAASPTGLMLLLQMLDKIRKANSIFRPSTGMVGCTIFCTLYLPRLDRRSRPKRHKEFRRGKLSGITLRASSRPTRDRAESACRSMNPRTSIWRGRTSSAPE